MNQPWPNRLLHAAVFPHPVAELKLLETHISWIILTGDFAYKIKKPVNFEFLDFSTLEKRHYYCQRELQLNRRFAPELYLEVVAISDTGGHPKVGNAENIIDYAVKMRQFDNDQLADKIAERHELTANMVRQLAQEIAIIHRQFLPYHPTTEAGTPEAFARALNQNFHQIDAYALDDSVNQKLVTLRKWQQQTLTQLYPFMYLRMQEGWVKDCHGDCHLGNIVFIDGKPTLFDCIEFNDEFRVMDTMAEAAFLSMDLFARKLPQLANRFLNDYLEYRGDYQGLQLLELYRSYFALVRAKVNLLKEDSHYPVPTTSKPYTQFETYLQLAKTFTPAKPVFLAIMHGVSGTGKSHLAADISARTAAVRIRSDVERKRLFNLNPEQSSTAVADIYSASASRQTFARLLELAQIIINAGFPCIVDATFLEQSTRRPFLEWAQEHRIPFAILSCRAVEATIRERLLARVKEAADASEADIDIYEQQMRSASPITEQESAFTQTIDTEAPDSAEIAAKLLLDLAT